jgi:hypothetical protein
MTLKNIEKTKNRPESCAYKMLHIPTKEKELSKFQLLSHTDSFHWGRH